jgi:hypothetical protein
MKATAAPRVMHSRTSASPIPDVPPVIAILASRKAGEALFRNVVSIDVLLSMD